jgi:hypothetical protein
LVPKQIAAVRRKSTSQLREIWQTVYRGEAPAKLRREFLIAFLAYRIQELEFGGLRQETKKRLRELSRPFSRDAGQPNPRSVMRPGTQLFREWHGERHEVCVMDSGFEYRGIRYKSLSQIARKITGTAWSGPAFFGLRKTGSKTQVAA